MATPTADEDTTAESTTTASVEDATVGDATAGSGIGVSRPRRSARLVLAVGVFAGLVYLGHKLGTEAWMVGLDFRVYRGAAGTALSGGPVYGTSPIGVPGMTYRYPPTVLLAFLPTVFLPWRVGYVLHTALVVAAALALAALIVRYVEERGVALSTVDRALVGALCLASAHAIPSLVFGNVNHFVALGLAAGIYWLDRGTETRSGATLALAALPKVFPAAVGVWLVRRHARRALAVALATGVSLLGVGLVAFGPRTSRRWVTAELLPRLHTGAFAGGLSPSSHLVTLRRPISVTFPHADPSLYGVAAVLLVAPVVGYLLVVTGDAGTDHRLGGPVALFGLLAGVFLVLPSSHLYFVYVYLPLVPLLYLLDGPGRRPFLAGAVLAQFPVQRNDLALALAKLPPGSAVDDAVMGVVGPVLAFGTPVLYGLCLCLGGCVWWCYAGEPE